MDGTQDASRPAKLVHSMRPDASLEAFLKPRCERTDLTAPDAPDRVCATKGVRIKMPRMRGSAVSAEILRAAGLPGKRFSRARNGANCTRCRLNTPDKKRSGRSGTTRRRRRGFAAASSSRRWHSAQKARGGKAAPTPFAPGNNLHDLL